MNLLTYSNAVGSLDDMLMNIFGPKVEFSDENEKHGFSKICDMLSIKITGFQKYWRQ